MGNGHCSNFLNETAKKLASTHLRPSLVALDSYTYMLPIDPGEQKSAISIVVSAAVIARFSFATAAGGGCVRYGLMKKDFYPIKIVPSSLPPIVITSGADQTQRRQVIFNN